MITLFLVPLRGVQAMRRPRAEIGQLLLRDQCHSHTLALSLKIQIRWYNVQYDIIQ